MPAIELYLLVLFSFAASVVSTFTGMGGGIVLLATATLVLPIGAVIPVSAAILLGGQFSRLFYFYRYICWDIAVPFVLGSAVGAVVGAKAYSIMPDYVLSFVLGVSILALIWLPPLKVSLRLPMPYIWLGAAHTALSTITGLGGLLQGLLLRSSLTRHMIIATIAASLCCMSLFKVASYVWIGFDYWQYIVAMVFSTVAGVLGTVLAKCWVHKISETVFRSMMRWMLTAFSVRLFWLAYHLYPSA